MTNRGLLRSSLFRASPPLTSLLLAAALLAACGDDSATGGTGGTGGEAGSPNGTGGNGGNPVVVPNIEGVRAPTRSTIEITFEGEAAQLPTDAAAYEITSARGPLTVESVEVTDGLVTLTTAKQKLGIEYTLTIHQPEGSFDSQGGTFLAADTAIFWASDFTDFSEFQLEAVRLGVGENVVIYASPDVPADDVEETIEYFDTTIVPIETELFHSLPDRDDNGKVVLLALDGQGFYAGYFNPIDSVSEEQATQWGYHSNEAEMLYLSTPDMNGSLGPVDVVSHELAHLLYNEQHDFFSADWNWHNEGLAECAVHAVSGSNPTAAWYYTAAPELVNGQSLVQWQYANYAQYAQAYVFWTYLAGRLGGVSAYGDLFDLSGSPSDIGNYLQQKLGSNFADTHLDMLTAVWLQEPNGKYSFNGMLTLSSPQLASQNIVNLAPFTAAFIPAPSNGLTPTNAGPNVRHRGLATIADLDSPFDSQGGAIVALNANQNASSNTQESSGSLVAAPPSPPQPLPRATPAHLDHFSWKHPPPLKPANRKALLAWRKNVHGF